MNKKYYIIPISEIAMEVNAPNADEAMDDFAWNMDYDMNAYFRAVTEEEYKEYIDKRNWKIVSEFHINFYETELIDNFEIPEEDVRFVAENAYDIYCNAGSYPYCDVETEYDALEKAVDEYMKGR